MERPQSAAKRLDPARIHIQPDDREFARQGNCKWNSDVGVSEHHDSRSKFRC